FIGCRQTQYSSRRCTTEGQPIPPTPPPDRDGELSLNEIVCIHITPTVARAGARGPAAADRPVCTPDAAEIGAAFATSTDAAAAAPVAQGQRGGVPRRAVPHGAGSAEGRRRHLPSPPCGALCERHAVGPLWPAARGVATFAGERQPPHLGEICASRRRGRRHRRRRHRPPRSAPPPPPPPPSAGAGGARRSTPPPSPPLSIPPRSTPPHPIPLSPYFLHPPTPPQPMSSPIPVLAPPVSASASSAAAAAVGVAALAASSSHAARPQFRRFTPAAARGSAAPNRRSQANHHTNHGLPGLPGLPPAAAAQLAAFAAALGAFFPPVVAAAKGFGAARRPGGFGSPPPASRGVLPTDGVRSGSKGSGKLRPCEPCAGTGLKRCAFCRGGGVMVGYLGAAVPCVPCEQKGTMGRPCPDCGGMGFFQ
ncbi:hypothetical protein BU14_0465s0001, partial [Porphyra umbilicalis]